MCHKCKSLNQMTPSYVSESLKVYVPARQLISSADQTTLIVPNRNFKSSGYLSFFYFLDPRLWNSLPQKIKEASSIHIFKIVLKHHFFSETYLVWFIPIVSSANFCLSTYSLCFPHFILCMAFYNIFCVVKRIELKLSWKCAKYM